MAYEVVMPYHLHMPSYFLETFTEYPYKAYYGHAFFICKKRILTEKVSECTIHLLLLCLLKYFM